VSAVDERRGAARAASRVAPPAASASALYVGTVMHQRLRPARHRLSYRMFSLLLDLDELPALARRLRLFSLDRFNLFSLHQRDHGDGSAGGLRAQIDARLREADLPVGGAIRLLTMPRILGYAFNPISVYFCDDHEGALQAIVYEVNNTFGERHSYLIPVDAAGQRGDRVVQGCAKAMRVSPFLPLDLRYVFRVEPPRADTAALSLGVVARDDVGAIVNARFDAERRTLHDAALARVFFSHPLLTLKVIAAIHWEALRLLLKGVRLQPSAPPRTPAPTPAPTLVQTPDR
jgi:uncharacterized protein